MGLFAETYCAWFRAPRADEGGENLYPADQDSAQSDRGYLVADEPPERDQREAMGATAGRFIQRAGKNHPTNE